MHSGAARIDESSTIAELRRRGRQGKAVPAGMLGALTVVCWAVWIYLVLPLVSLVLWAAGVQLFVKQNRAGSYDALAQTLLSYSSVLAVMVGLLAIWIFWNVARYSGTLDRRTAKRSEVTSLEVWKHFRLDQSIGGSLRQARAIRLDLDREGSVVVVAPVRGSAARPDREARVAGHQPRSYVVVDEGADTVGTRVREVEEVVEVR
jgi:poly-beta-1,6-N-acetyl-D-glucosamine biosynthesis protein PgaD